MTGVTRGFAGALGLLLLLAGCSAVPVPQDPDGTLERVRATHELRVGASPSEGLVEVEGDEVTGPEADLAEAFAQAQGAEVVWRPGGEEELVTALESGELDLVVGGLSAKSPWSSKVALTRPYATRQVQGERVEQVLAAPLGENALLLELETFLDGRRP